MSDGDTTPPSGGTGLIALLTAIQQAVATVNNLTQSIKLVFPSSS